MTAFPADWPHPPPQVQAETWEDLYHGAPCAYLSTDPDGLILRANRTFLNWTGHAAGELIGLRKFRDLLPLSQQIFHDSHYVPSLRLGGAVSEVMLEILSKTGARLPVLVNSVVVRDDGGNPLMHRITLFNVAERQKLEKQLVHARRSAEAAANRLQNVLESTTDSVLVVDRDWRITFVNRRACLAHKIDMGLVGANLATMLKDAQLDGVAELLANAMFRRAPAAFEQFVPTWGQWLEIQAYGTEDGLSIFFRDVTKRRADQDRIAYLAHHDPLTGLPNRLTYQERIAHALAQASPHRYTALHCLDLDGFKQINDTFGHIIGDKLLRQVAARLRPCIGEGDTLARLGGDEFSVIQIGVRGQEEAAALARRMIGALAIPFGIDGEQITMGTTIGIAMAPDDGDHLDALLQHADIALYRGKAGGGGVHCFFKPHMDECLRERRELKHDLARALEAGQLQVVYQPIIDLASNTITGVEALLRWNHPVRGPISPAIFIPLAEETDLIVEIGSWVLREATRIAATWPHHIWVAVNLSPVQFHRKDLSDVVVDALRKSELHPSRLVLEITESLPLDDSQANLDMLGHLHCLGVRIALDDFGTGYASLSYLRRFPFSKIKIDRSFIAGLPGDDNSRAIVRAIVGLGRALGMKVTAEGIETWEHLLVVKAEGCQFGQVYHFSAPINAEAATRLLQGTIPIQAPAAATDSALG